MARSDELVEIVKVRKLESYQQQLTGLAPIKSHYYFRRRAWLEARIAELQYELGQYELTDLAKKVQRENYH